MDKLKTHVLLHFGDAETVTFDFNRLALLSEMMTAVGRMQPVVQPVKTTGAKVLVGMAAERVLAFHYLTVP